MSNRISLLGIFLVVGVYFLAAAPAAYANDTILSSVYQDSNNDGKVDRIRWTMDENVTACVYEAADWTVNVTTDMTIGISGLSCTTTDQYLYISLNADADETGAATDPVISYADNATLGSVKVTSADMAAKSNITATDAAKPIITAASFGSTLAYGYVYNRFTAEYSESSLIVSRDAGGDSDIASGANGTSTATLGGMTVARTIAGIASWGGTGEVSTSSAVGNTVSYTGNSITVTFNTLASAYFFGTIAPATGAISLTGVEDASDVKDAAGNPVNGLYDSLINDPNDAAWDTSAPTVTNTYSCDTDSDGDIDRIQIIFNESILDSSININNLDLDNDVTNNATGEEVPASYATGTGGCDGSPDVNTADDDRIRLNLTNGISGTDVAYFHNVAAGLRDIAGHRMETGTALGTENDKAAPLLIAQSPASGGTATTTTAIALTFSEAITTASFAYTLSGSPTLSSAWSAGNSILTLTPVSNLIRGANTFTVTTAPDASALTNAFGSALSPIVNPFSFVVSGGSSSSETPTVEAYSVTLLSPNGGEAYIAGETVAVTWSSTGSAMSYVSLYYTTDSGTTYSTIVEDVTNNGSYSWTVPDVDSSSVTLYIVGSDLATNLANDVSDAVFTLGDGGSSTTEEVAETETIEAPSSGTSGVSPVTGEEEDVSSVAAGDFIKSPSFSTVYYIDENLVRHPFLDTQSYFTYQDDFSAIITVTDATLPTLTLGVPMLPKATVALIKIQSDDAVYALDDGGLRHVTSEEVALINFGQAWADYVIDVPPTLFWRFTLGNDLNALEFGHTAGMKTRYALSIENPEGDIDGDGLTNAVEVQLGTTLDDADTDNDGYPDALEVGTGHDPLTAIDSDSDGYPDYLEILHGYNPYDPSPTRT